MLCDNVYVYACTVLCVCAHTLEAYMCVTLRVYHNPLSACTGRQLSWVGDRVHSAHTHVHVCVCVWGGGVSHFHAFLPLRFICHLTQAHLAHLAHSLPTVFVCVPHLLQCPQTTTGVCLNTSLNAPQLRQDSIILQYIHKIFNIYNVYIVYILQPLQQDSIITSYRDHCHMLTRGGSVAGIMAELFGRATGHTKGGWVI